MTRSTRFDTLEAALAQMFETAAGQKEASWFCLPGGAELFCAGDPADQLYLLKSGRLGVYKTDETGQNVFVGLVEPGEPVGEMAMIADTPHSSSVIALRDSDILALPRSAFLKAIQSQPDIMTELARMIVLRSREGGRKLALPRVFGFLAMTRCALREPVEALASRVRNMGYRVEVITAEALRSATHWFSRVEDETDYVFYVAEHHELTWASLVLRQVDHLFLSVRTDLAIPRDLDWEEDPLSAHRPRDLLLLRPPGTRPAHSQGWLKAIKPQRWFHIEDRNEDDLMRLARIVTGQSVGLVLSGGGARAFAHVGAIQALREIKCPIDFVGGASMGAIIAAMVGMSWDQGEMDWRIRKAFVESSPLDDISFPILAMTQGHKVDVRLEEHFGDQRIEDLPIPFFCVSSNLTTGVHQRHDTGLLWRALRASISLPGVMPPVIEQGQVLVDGAVMRSFPADLMRDWHHGTVVGVDVTRARGLDPKAVETPKSMLGWFLSGEWRKGPPIVNILMRSATITTASDLMESRRATDLLILPQPNGVELRDWDLYDRAVLSGYQTMVDTLSTLSRPIARLRQEKIKVHPDGVSLITLDAEPSQIALEQKSG